MRYFRKKTPSIVFLLVVSLFMLTGCLSRMQMKQDPFYETFFEKTRLIMTDDEIEIYKHLPDKQSKEEFIEEFWRIRDPDPGTEENENKIEFKF